MSTVSPSKTSSTASTIRPRVGGVLLAFALGAGVTGFIVATRSELTPPPRASARTDDATRTSAGLRVAPRYSTIQPGAFSVNAAWRASIDPAVLAGPGAADRVAFYGAAPASQSERVVAVERREDRRAYRGAPPVVPHSIDQTGTAACLACHEHGFRVGDVTVPPMSHRPYANCTQCHVEASGVPPVAAGAGVGLLTASQFNGLVEPGPGSRAWPGAPPTIPHATWMRESCASCHGALASDGLRASHPWRASCTQCHAPSARFDQMPVPLSPLPRLE